MINKKSLNIRYYRISYGCIAGLSTAWMLEGDYFEGCNCDIVCPCVFLSNPDEGNCHVTCAWHIQKGNYGDTNLNNLNVVAMFNSPGNMFTGPKWKGSIIHG